MTLAICIPTHHGRARYLQELLESIARQEGIPNVNRLEVCVSDNASNDGTAELIEEYKRTAPFPLKYFRFPTDMGGVRNFANVVDMAETDFCWLVGSDDVLMPRAVASVLRVLDTNPYLSGFSVNKLNFDSPLTAFVNVDHEVVLPAEPWRTRSLNSFEEVVANLAMLFTYMSGHIFRRVAWQAVVQAFSLEYLITLRHFPHWFVFVQIAKKADRWFWLADFLVIQRLDNSCVLEEAANRESVFATEVTEDLLKVHDVIANVPITVRPAIVRKLFLIYWNPWSILKYKSWPGISADEQRALSRQCTRWFGGVPLFWVTSYPVLLTPAPIVRPIKALIDAVRQGLLSISPEGRLVRVGMAIRHVMLRTVRIEHRDMGLAAAGAAAAAQYMSTLHQQDGRASRLTKS